MSRLSKALMVLGLFSLSAFVRANGLRLSSSDRLLILAPHPDDEVLCCGGVIQQALEQHLPVEVIFLTYGDNNAWSFTRYNHFPTFLPKTMRTMGMVRHDESVASDGVLGLSSGTLVFLGYPDYGTLPIWNEGWDDAAPAFESMLTHVRAVPYANAYRPSAPYKGEEILADLESTIEEFRPTKIFFPHPADDRPDHRAMCLFTYVALWDLAPDIHPDAYFYIVHLPHWPLPEGLHLTENLQPPEILSALSWITVPLSVSQVERKQNALQKHRTQYAYSQTYLDSFLRKNELFVTGTKDTIDWSVTQDHEDLLISGHMQQPPTKGLWITAFGYRKDIPFKKMPKVCMPLPATTASGNFTVRIPLAALGHPEKLLIGGGVKQHGLLSNWSFVKVIEKL